MTTSGTFAFNPSLGELVISAYGRIGVKRTELLTQHMIDARMESNLLLTEWSNKQPNLWTVDLKSQALVQGTASYTLDANTIEILDAYISVTASGVTTDRMIFPISRTDYAALPDKARRGPPSVFWLNRQKIPVLNLWTVPDLNTYTLKYYRVRQIEDASLPGGLNIEAPYRFADAFIAGLAHRLTRSYAPQLEQLRAQDAMLAWNIACAEDKEFVNLSIVPAIGSYYI